MFTLFQITSIVLFTAVITYDASHLQLMNYGRLVFTGLVIGLIMGNVNEGLLIGGTMELMSLGIAGFGGAPIPNYMLGSIIGIAFASVTHGGIESGLAVGIPVAALGVQLDLLAKMLGSFFLHKALNALDRMDFKTMYRWIISAMIPRIFFTCLVILIALTIGADFIVTLLAMMPKWMSLGLSVAGGLLPAVGFAILMKYLPLRQYFIYALLGFLLSSYFSLPIIGVALFGFIIAFNIYVQSEKQAVNVVSDLPVTEISHQANILSKKLINKARNRWMTTGQTCFNYESMQAASIAYALGPCLEKIYEGSPEAYRDALKVHFRFFNTHPWMANIILSSALAIEENGGESASEAASSIRTSLMGPFAGLGDSILTVLPKTIFGAIAAYMALTGNATGILLCLGVGVIMLIMRVKLWDIGYTQGVRFITTSQSKLKSITTAASVLGLVVVGALVASNVKVAVSLSFKIGESVTKIQDIFNKIIPNLLPLLAVVLVYWLLGKKGMTSAKMVWIIILFAIAAAYFRILG